MGLIKSLSPPTISFLGPASCCYTGPSVCHFLLLHIQSSVFVCVLCASRDGGQGDFSVSERTIPLLMHLSALCFVNRDQQTSGRLKEDEIEGRGNKWMRERWEGVRSFLLGTQGRFIIYLWFMAVAASSFIVDWIVGCSAFLLRAV